MVDPPRPLSKLGFTIGQQGITLRERKVGDRIVYDAWDWIGAGSGPYAKGYWNVPDFTEEGQRISFSGRVPANKELLAKLTNESLHPCVHPRACVKDASGLWRNRMSHYCRGHRPEHEADQEHADWTCISFLWELIESGMGNQLNDNPRDVVRFMPPKCNQDPTKRPTFSYEGWEPPAGVDLIYEPGLFLVLPITRLALVRDHSGAQGHEPIAEMVHESGTGLELAIVDE